MMDSSNAGECANGTAAPLSSAEEHPLPDHEMAGESSTSLPSLSMSSEGWSNLSEPPSFEELDRIGEDLNRKRDEGLTLATRGDEHHAESDATGTSAGERDLVFDLDVVWEDAPEAVKAPVAKRRRGVDSLADPEVLAYYESLTFNDRDFNDHGLSRAIRSLARGVRHSSANLDQTATSHITDSLVKPQEASRNSQPRGNLKRVRLEERFQVTASPNALKPYKRRQSAAPRTDVVEDSSGDIFMPEAPPVKVEAELSVEDRLPVDINGITDIRVFHPNYAPSVAKLDGGQWLVPDICTRCRAKGTFCDRDSPCSNCKKASEPCVRQEGKWVKPTKAKSSNLQTCGDKVIPTPIVKPVVKPAKSRIKVKKAAPLKLKPNAHKPPPIGTPVCWAETRQELCEGLPAFRSYQSGNYSHNGIMFGYLVDATDSERDYMDGSIVITHSGGKSKIDPNDPEGVGRCLSGNHTLTDNTIKALVRCYKDKYPIMFVVGQDCPTSPSCLPYRYAVMDWFKVTTLWAEKDSRSDNVRYKFRFEKLDTSSHGWWNCEGGLGVVDHLEMEFETCAYCNKQSSYIYDEEWFCTHPTCEMFWKVPSNNNEAPCKFVYRKSFLHSKTAWDYEMAPGPLAPPQPDLKRLALANGGDVTRFMWKAIHCQDCGRLSCRELWVGWVCRNCGRSTIPPRSILDQVGLADPHQLICTGAGIALDTIGEKVYYETGIKFVNMINRNGEPMVGHFRVNKYFLGNAGTVTHIVANSLTNAAQKDADWLLSQYLSADMPFKRRALKNHKSVGRLLTQQFTFNAGAPYKYIVESDSAPFDESPEVVNRALEIIKHRARILVEDADFNEILSVGYFEGQSMGFHDDGESDLGSTVASISVGCPARMKFRLKKKYVDGKMKLSTDNLRVLAPYHLLELEPNGGDDAQIEHQQEDPAGKDAGVEGVAEDEAKTKKKGIQLDMLLNHGDVMIMQGQELQKYWEHSVVPTGIFRVAATARWIGPPMLTSEEPGLPIRPLRSGTPESPEYELLSSPSRLTTRSSSVPLSTGAVISDFTMSPSADDVFEHSQDTIYEQSSSAFVAPVAAPSSPSPFGNHVSRRLFNPSTALNRLNQTGSFVASSTSPIRACSAPLPVIVGLTPKPVSEVGSHGQFII